MQVDVKRIVKDLGLTYKESGNNLKVLCWNPRHKETEPSVSIQLDTGIYHCFGCGISGNILSLAKDKLGLTQAEAVQYIDQQVKGGKTQEEINDFLLTKMTRSKPLEDSVECQGLKHKLISTHPYLEGRGFTPQEIEKWKIGVVDEPGHQCNGWIYIPIYQEAELKTWFCRCHYSKDKIYGYYRDENNIVKGYTRNNLLFGLDGCDTNKEIYVMEGIFDKIIFDRTRVQAVACLSNRLLPKQLDKLKNFKRVVLVLDNDLQKRDEGLLLAHSARLLLNYTDVWVCILPLHRKDVNECNLDELLYSKYHLISLLEFIATERYLKWLSYEVAKHE